VLGRDKIVKINKAAGAAILAVATAGSLFTGVAGASAAARPAAHPNVAVDGTVTVNHTTGLVDGQSVTVTASGFPVTATTLYTTECSTQALATQNAAYCDTDPSHASTITATGGGGTGTYKIRTGSDFSPGIKTAKCDNLHLTCYLIVADGATSATTNHVGFATIHFKDTRATTTTKLKGAKSAKAKKKVTITATTKHGKTAPTGTVTFKDGSKVVAKVKETKTGVVKAKIKVAKGTNKIKAVYSGDINYKPSTGKFTVKGKK
jgi:hypothetical protein